MICNWIVQMIRKMKSNDACISCLYRGSGTQDYSALCNACRNFDKYESFEDCIAEGRYIRHDIESLKAYYESHLKDDYKEKR